ncbi:unnamed protein product [Somion occarium]|uniref:Heterokaryon incompatibility domain-containing protein n=1 Tax=Somion occarium TaxID=3059160 RepID=A0ABP1DTB8_9APHY
MGDGSATASNHGIVFVSPSLQDSYNHPLALYEPKGEQIRDITPKEVPTVPEGKVIYSQSLPALRAAAGRDERIDVTDCATAERYRFIDCNSFVRHGVLELWEVPQLPIDQYIAISHIWKSKEPRPHDLTTNGVFLVECEERNDGGPISIDVLRYSSSAALQMGIRLLWLDRLCILQTPTTAGQRDKRWQILHMYDVYKGCHACLVLPAGLQRFPDESEETGGVERA